EQDVAPRPRPAAPAEGARRDPAVGGNRVEHRDPHAGRRRRELRRLAPAPLGELPGPRDARTWLRSGYDEAARGRLRVRRLAPAGRVVAAKSFVGGSALTDEQGHGTFVAGEIAAATNNGVGIAGIAFPAKLVIAKVVRGDEIPLGAETAAIRWAVGQGARVINLSLGGLRDPGDPLRHTVPPVEASAIDYAVAHGVVVVAAVGNGDQAPRTPWPYASYPAALPHVIGVSAYARDGSVPSFSNRDAVFNDLTAPGQDILSTLPRSLTASRPGCVDQGYSDC